MHAIDRRHERPVTLRWVQLISVLPLIWYFTLGVEDRAGHLPSAATPALGESERHGHLTVQSLADRESSGPL